VRPPDAQARLTEALAAVGVPVRDGRGSGEHAHQAWEGFCALAREPADEPFTSDGELLRVADHDDADLLLHESYLAEGLDVYVVAFVRQFSFEVAESGEHAGMNALLLELWFDGVPAGRVPKAQRWGYAGRHREDVGDEAHPDMDNWAGWVDSWKTAVETSNSFRVLETLPVSHFTLSQTDI
jgi:hypothetical protein